MKLFLIFTLLFFLLPACTSDEKNGSLDSFSNDLQLEKKSQPDTVIVYQPQALPSALNEFINPGFQILDTATGDLNLDGITDWILILKRNDEENQRHDPPWRSCLLICGSAEGKYRLASKNNKAVDRFGTGGMRGPDAYCGIRIERGCFEIIHLTGFVSHTTISTVRFAYSSANKNWYCISQTEYWYNANVIGTDSLNKYSGTEIKNAADFGVLSFEDYEIYK